MIDKKDFINKVVFGYIKKDLENMRDKIRPEPSAVGNINFPLALCVLAYMEYLGSFLLGKDSGFSKNVSGYISKCFSNHKDYPVGILRDIFRNGLAHEYFARGGISRDGERPPMYKEVFGPVLDAETLVNDFLNSLDKFRDTLDDSNYNKRIQAAEKSISKKIEENKNLIESLPVRLITPRTRSSGASVYPGQINTTTTSTSSSQSKPSRSVSQSAITRPYNSDEV